MNVRFNSNSLSLKNVLKIANRSYSQTQRIGRSNAVKPRSRNPKNIFYSRLAAFIALPLAYGAYSAYASSYKNANGEILSVDRFKKFEVSNKLEISPDLFLIELRSSSKDKALPWNCTKSWSVEVKNPLMQIARHYTPMPMHIEVSESNNAVLKQNSPQDNRFCLLVRKYNTGDMTRFICSKNIGEALELRGPSEDCILSSKSPTEICLFTAGTGIVVPLQLLLSDFDNKLPVLKVLQSSRTVLPDILRQVLNQFQTRGSIGFKLFTDERNEFIQPVDVPESTPSSFGIVCGPPGYIKYTSGNPGYDGRAPIRGILSLKGWNSSNTVRMADI